MTIRPSMLKPFPSLLVAGAALLSIFGGQAVRASEEAPWVGDSIQGRPCSSFPHANQGYTGGGLDYNQFSSADQKLRVVERSHFTSKVKTLRGGEHHPNPLGDLNYTLRAFPNHHEALFAIIRYFTEGTEQKGKAPSSSKHQLPPECYLQRAIQFRPEDGNNYILYGIYLHRMGRLEEAKRKYEKGLELMPRSAEGHYNLGLLLVDMGAYEEAREAARKAYEMGYPLSGLRKRLAEKGYPL